MSAATGPYEPRGAARLAETAGAWLLAVLWILPLVYAVWAAFHAPEFSARFSPSAPWTLENFARAWEAAPFARYFLNTFALVTLVLACQFLLCTLAAYAFARYRFVGREVVFALVLAQLMIMPDVLIVENYRTMSWLGILDSIPAIALPYVASAFGIFLLRQTFKTVPKELEDAARIEGAGDLQILLRVYVPLARPVYIAYGLVSVSYHWNNFLWPLIVTRSADMQTLPLGLARFLSYQEDTTGALYAFCIMVLAPGILLFLLAQNEFIRGLTSGATKG